MDHGVVTVVTQFMYFVIVVISVVISIGCPSDLHFISCLINCFNKQSMYCMYVDRRMPATDWCGDGRAWGQRGPVPALPQDLLWFPCTQGPRHAGTPHAQG